MKKKKAKEDEYVEIRIKFYYKESVRHVYKKVHYFINKNRVTLRKIRKYFPKVPYIFTANTYFWSPGGKASYRRSRESNRYEEVEEWFKEKGFYVKYEDSYLIGYWYPDKKSEIYWQIIAPLQKELEDNNYFLKRLIDKKLTLYEFHKYYKGNFNKINVQIESIEKNINLNDYPQFKEQLELYKAYYQEYIKLLMEVVNDAGSETK